MVRSEKIVEKARRRAHQIRQIHALLSVEPALSKHYIAEQLGETSARCHYLLTYGRMHYGCFRSDHARGHWFVGEGSPP